jgi:glutamine amidotransferase
MQWNLVHRVADRPSRLLGGGADGVGGAPWWFYFVHSYAPVPSGAGEAGVVGCCDYGGDVVAAYESGSLFGTQFHPEKSGATGLELLTRFASLCGGG